MHIIYTKSNGKAWYAGYCSMIPLIELIQTKLDYDNAKFISTEVNGFKGKIFDIRHVHLVIEQILGERTPANQILSEAHWDGTFEDVEDESMITADNIIEDVLGCFILSTKAHILIPSHLTANTSPVDKEF